MSVARNFLYEEIESSAHPGHRLARTLSKAWSCSRGLQCRSISVKGDGSYGWACQTADCEFVMCLSCVLNDQGLEVPETLHLELHKHPFQRVECPYETGYYFCDAGGCDRCESGRNPKQDFVLTGFTWHCSECKVTFAFTVLLWLWDTRLGPRVYMQPWT
jgi:hypothetical protein